LSPRRWRNVTLLRLGGSSITLLQAVDGGPHHPEPQRADPHLPLWKDRARPLLE